MMSLHKLDLDSMKYALGIISAGTNGLSFYYQSERQRRLPSTELELADQISKIEGILL